jgi:glutathione S-transferase
MHDAVCPEREARSRRIQMAKRDVERALRSREQLQEALRAADAAAGRAIRRLLGEGLTAVDAAVLVRLSRSQIKRLLRVTAGPSGPASNRSSTERRSGGAPKREDVDRELNGAARGATTEGNV